MLSGTGGITTRTHWHPMRQTWAKTYWSPNLHKPILWLGGHSDVFSSWNQCQSVQLLSHVQLFVIPWTAAHQASLVITNSQSLLKLMSISQWCHPTISSSVIPFSSYIQSFPASGSFPVSPFFASGDQSIRVSASASVFPINIQDWFPSGLTGWSCSPRDSQESSNITVQYFCFLLNYLHLQWLWPLSLTTVHMIKSSPHPPHSWSWG